jgi:hypothetical protein
MRGYGNLFYLAQRCAAFRPTRLIARLLVRTRSLPGTLVTVRHDRLDLQRRAHVVSLIGLSAPLRPGKLQLRWRRHMRVLDWFERSQDLETEPCPASLPCSPTRPSPGHNWLNRTPDDIDASWAAVRA